MEQETNGNRETSQKDSIIGTILSRIDELTNQVSRTRNRVTNLESKRQGDQKTLESLRKQVGKIKELKDFRKSMRTSERRRFTE